MSQMLKVRTFQTKKKSIKALADLSGLIYPSVKDSKQM